MYTLHLLAVDTTPVKRNCLHYWKLFPLELHMLLREGSSGPAGGNMVADLSSVQILNIRLLYKVAVYAKVHKC